MRISDWSSDVCSSDLHRSGTVEPDGSRHRRRNDDLHVEADPGAVRHRDVGPGQPDAAEPAPAVPVIRGAPRRTRSKGLRQMSIVTKHRLEDMLAATPSRMVVMLYDEAIGALRTSVMAIAADDIECRCNSVTAALEIVGHLYLFLDEAQVGDVARNLGQIYGHVISRLPLINLYNDTEIAEEAVELLEMLRDSWIELDTRIADGTADLAVDAAIIAAAGEMQRSDARNG